MVKLNKSKKNWIPTLMITHVYGIVWSLLLKKLSLNLKYSWGINLANHFIIPIKLKQRIGLGHLLFSVL